MIRMALNTVVNPALLAPEALASVDVATLLKRAKRNTRLRVQSTVLPLSWEFYA